MISVANIGISEIIPKWNIENQRLNLQGESKRFDTRKAKISRETVPDEDRIGH